MRRYPSPTSTDCRAIIHGCKTNFRSCYRRHSICRCGRTRWNCCGRLWWTRCTCERSEDGSLGSYRSSLQWVRIMDASADVYRSQLVYGERPERLLRPYKRPETRCNARNQVSVALRNRPAWYQRPTNTNKKGRSYIVIKNQKYIFQITMSFSEIIS